MNPTSRSFKLLMMKTGFSVFFTIVFSICSAQPSSGRLQQFAWILGKWEMKTEKRTFFEYWVTMNDSTFQGTSFKVTEHKDTIILETSQLAVRERKFYYIPTVTNQNNQQPVFFEITQIRQGEFIAENPKHDFPQRIGYKRTGDRIDAWIDGEVNGKYSKEDYPFKKM